MKPSGTPTDASWILRFWLEQEKVWRPSLHNPTTGDRVGFADLEAMFDYLRRETETMGDAWQGVKEAQTGKEGCDET